MYILSIRSLYDVLKPVLGIVLVLKVAQLLLLVHKRTGPLSCTEVVVESTASAFCITAEEGKCCLVHKLYRIALSVVCSVCVLVMQRVAVVSQYPCIV